MSTWESISTGVGNGSDWSDPPTSGRALPPRPTTLLETESGFYRRYRWCLDAFPPVREVMHRLRRELSALDEVEEDWQRDEVAVNVFLLSCALSDTVDDYLAGDRYDFSRATTALPWVRLPARLLEGLLAAGGRCRTWRLRGLHRWRERWRAAVDAVLQASLGGSRRAQPALAGACSGLSSLLAFDLPARLLSRRAKVPAAFRTQDLTHHDVLALANKFAATFPDRKRPLVVLGLRTAGSYFAPLLRAALAVRGFRDLEVETLRPKKGVAPWEHAALARCAARRGLAVVVDEPAHTGATLAEVVAILRRACIPIGDIVALLPRHPSRRQWQGGYESLPVSDVRVLTLEPEEWRKGKLLEPHAVEHRLQAYFRPGGYARAAVVPSAAAERFNRHLERISEQKFHSRLKRVYEVQLRHMDGHAETRYVLAKSVGWGWLGYHAFLAGQALSGFVPPLLGLRDGILYSEWLPAGDPPLPQDRDRLLSSAASYVAARVRSLRLETDPGPELEPQNGRELLAGALIRAFGSPSAALKRARIRRELSREACPVPTLIDGKMRLQEWVRGPQSFLKSDYEHHGMGKTELNVTDPAYDLAEVILYLHLSPAEEKDLLQRYRQACDDQGVEERLFLHKLLAGMAALSAALGNLKEPRLQHRHEEFNRSYIQAWDFLIAQTVRFSGRACRHTEPPSWRSPLVVMDIDGVLDKQIFGYPSTTAAGIEAVSLLHAHGCAVALNTARALPEVQEYARAYGCVGGVAEYGSVVWDAVAGRTRVLVTPESQAELQRMAEALRSIPGVFLNDGYEHSLRAYTYAAGRTNPLPTALVEGLLTQLGLERLTVHQTYLDTAILAREIDKGQGLLALLRLAEREGIETIAIGDSEPDLAMFRVAGRSFAPGHMSGRSVARMLGCEIDRRSYQPGLLSAVRSIVHPEGGRCPRCRACRRPEGDGLFWELLKTADRRPIESLLRALVDPMSLRAFVR